MEYRIEHRDLQTRARCGILHLRRCDIKLPVFMPVGTYGTIKGLTSIQLKELGCEILLCNAYHMGKEKIRNVVKAAGGLHKFIGWDGAILTDSGGFQMVSLGSFVTVKEEGVTFLDPETGDNVRLMPEDSIQIQNDLGADIIMQLDDVVNPRSDSYRIFEAFERTIRWLDRSIEANSGEFQVLFPIVQGGLDPELRRRGVEEAKKRNALGYAIGGLCGGEEKKDFYNIVNLSTSLLPSNKPIYCMGIGYDIDILLCILLGVDMFDCVYPTRIARFGYALAIEKNLDLKNSRNKANINPIDSNCDCCTCKTQTLASLYSLRKTTVFCHYITIHNLRYMFRFMEEIRRNIKEGRYLEYVKEFLNRKYPSGAPIEILDLLNNLHSFEKPGYIPKAYQ